MFDTFLTMLRSGFSFSLSFSIDMRFLICYGRIHKIHNSLAILHNRKQMKWKLEKFFFRVVGNFSRISKLSLFKLIDFYSFLI